MEEAISAFDKYIVCVDRIPEEFEASLNSLVSKAIKAYENRGPNLRHGIALDRYVTVILRPGGSPRTIVRDLFQSPLSLPGPEPA